MLINYDASTSYSMTVSGTTTFVPKPEECFSCITSTKQYCTDKDGTNDCKADNSGCTKTLMSSVANCYTIPSVVTSICNTTMATIDPAVGTFSKTLTIPANNGCKFNVDSTSVKQIGFSTDVAANTKIYKGATADTVFT